MQKDRQSTTICTCDRNSKLRLCITVAISVFICWYSYRSVWTYLIPIFFSDLPTVPVNDQCRNGCPEQSITSNMQFENFIWLVADGMSWTKSQSIRDMLYPHAKIFKQKNNGSVYSDAVAKAGITGRSNCYFTIITPTGDDIFASFNRGRPENKIHHFGSRTVFFSTPFRDQVDQLKLFKTLDLQDDRSLHCNVSHCKFFNTEERKETFRQNLSRWHDNNESVFYWCDVDDDKMHSQRAKHNWTFPIIKELADQLAQDLVPVIHFIDNHPDTLLIVSADHGHDEPSLFLPLPHPP